ncbi:uncharacterized protein [Nicotiana tomentosiformis]|uniref:uncharacterized protein n=1 Tax=Nicotiana tomentosiformis TaxID=4098 RepID=UPI00388CE308
MEIETTLHRVIEIARRLERIRGKEREDTEAKKPCGFREFSVSYSGAKSRHVVIPVVQGRSSSSSHSSTRFYLFVCVILICFLDMSRDSLDALVSVSTPIGDSIMVDRVHRSCMISNGGYETRVDILFLNMVDFDVILGIDWLSPYYDILDCHAKTVTLPMQGYQGWNGEVLWGIFLVR